MMMPPFNKISTQRRGPRQIGFSPDSGSISEYLIPCQAGRLPLWMFEDREHPKGEFVRLWNLQ